MVSVEQCEIVPCRRLEALRRKERSEALLYLTVEVYREDEFQHHSGPDLISQDCQPLIFKVLKSTPLEEFHLALALSMVSVLRSF